MRLFDLFAPAFSAGLAIRRSIASGANKSRPVDEVQRELNTLCDSIERQARAAGKREPDIRAAMFAAVAWLDEVVAGDPDWFGFDVQPIQVVRFNSYQAGEEFYTQLMNLRPEQDEVREVYFTALCLGFLGKYALEPESAELRSLIASQGRQLPVKPINPATVADEKLTPQPYGVALPAQRRLPSDKGRRVMWAAIFVAVVAVVAWVVVDMIGKPGPLPVEPPVVIKDQEPPSPRPVEPVSEEKVRAIVEAEPCAVIAFALTPEGNITLSGFDQSEVSIRELRAKLLAMEGVGTVNVDALQVIPKPLCEVAKALHPFASAEALPLALRGGQLTAALGDVVAVETGATKAFDAYVYVDIYSPDGSVGHMAPDPAEEFKIRKAGSPVMAGKGDPIVGTQEWRVEPPGGPHLLVTISSPAKLFAKPRELGEDTQAYLAALEPALAAVQGPHKPVVKIVLLHLGHAP